MQSQPLCHCPVGPLGLEMWASLTRRVLCADSCASSCMHSTDQVDRCLLGEDPDAQLPPPSGPRDDAMVTSAGTKAIHPILVPSPEPGLWEASEEQNPPTLNMAAPPNQGCLRHRVLLTGLQQTQDQKPHARALGSPG